MADQPHDHEYQPDLDSKTRSKPTDPRRFRLPLGGALPSKAPEVLGLSPKTLQELASALNMHSQDSERFRMLLISWLLGEGVVIPQGVFMPPNRPKGRKFDPENEIVYRFWRDKKRIHPQYSWGRLAKEYAQAYPQTQKRAADNLRQAVYAAEKHYRSLSPAWEPEFRAHGG